MIMPNVLAFFLHLDKVLPLLFVEYGNGIYALLFLIIFCETGLVFMPFLPGDSLLFATGALIGISGLSIWGMWGLLILAAVLGDTLNYWIGNTFGQRLAKSRWVNPKYLAKSKAYFEKHGSRAIFLARFLPIFRTFVPFIAGISEMPYKTFMKINILGGVTWVSLFLWFGYWFGQTDWVKAHFSSIILGIIAVSLVPILYDILKHLLKRPT